MEIYTSAVDRLVLAAVGSRCLRYGSLWGSQVVGARPASKYYLPDYNRYLPKYVCMYVLLLVSQQIQDPR